MITETDAVHAALEPLRARGARIDFAELVCTGAEAMVRAIEKQEEDELERQRLLESLVERTHNGDGIDLDALFEVRERGWTHDVPRG